MAVTVLTAFFVLLEGRFFYLQILRGEDYRKRARSSVIARERIPPRRGLLKDREGKVLARNAPVYGVTLVPHFVADPPVRASVLDVLEEVLALGASGRAALEAKIDLALQSSKERWEPVSVPGRPVADTCPIDGAALELAQAPDRRLVCPEDGAVHVPIDPKAAYCPHDRARIVWKDGRAVCSKCERSYVSGTTCPDHPAARLRTVEHNLVCPVCSRTWQDQVAMLQARLHELPGVDVETELRREYPFGYDAAHVLGYMSRVTAEDRERFPGVYEIHDTIGRTGLERAMEDVLRGRTGEALYIRDSKGHRRRARDGDPLGGEMEFERAVPGHDVWLTLDMRLQKEVRAAFRYHRSGAAAVIDPRSGEVLALYSKPGFDPNDWSGRLTPEVWNEVQANPYTPLIDKAVTPYPPGSVYKIVTAAAAMAEAVATKDTVIECGGHYEFGGRRFHCHNKAGHGPLAVVDAIKHSCDVYFYRIGEMLGMDRLAVYGERFGFGRPTGIELAEHAGRVPTREWHAKHTALGWQPGFTLSTAIGQGSLTTTPLQVARAYAALVNGGHLLRLRLVDKVVGEDGDVLYEPGPKIDGALGLSPEALSVVREGLVRVVNDLDGTAPESAIEGIVMAGKTGTAEAAQVRPGAPPELAEWLKADHAWFAAYAPADDPQVIVVVFVEHGGGGSKVAAPIAKRIVQAWLRLGLYEGPAPEEAAAPPEAPAPPASETEIAPTAGRPAAP